MKNKKINISLIVSGVLSLSFILFTLLVKFVDTAYIGLTGKKIGLSFINKIFYDAFKVSDLFDTLSDIIMIVAILMIILVIVVGAVELIKRKSLKKVDKEVFAFGLVMIMLAALYVLFELIELNFRPVLIDGKIETSYPSSHIMIELTVFMCALVYILKNVKIRKYKLSLGLLLCVLMVVAVIFRVLSSMHWVTDIIASIILSLTLASYYVLFNNLFENFAEKQKEKRNITTHFEKDKE